MAKKSLLTTDELYDLEHTDQLEGLRYGRTSGVLQEQGPIRIIGCGQAGLSLASVFRRRPEWVSLYSRDVYPVNAISVDSQQESMHRAVHGDSKFQWPNEGTQLLGSSPEDGSLGEGSVKDQIVTHFALRTPAYVTGNTRDPGELKDFLLENAAVRGGYGGELHPLDEELRLFWGVGAGGAMAAGAGGLALDGRAAALWTLDEREEWLATQQGNAQFASFREPIERALTSREGYTLLTMASIDGGTGSGSSGVINAYINKYLQPPHPLLKLTLGVFTSVGPDSSDQSMANRLVSLYYLLKNPRDTDGVILVDNSEIKKNSNSEINDHDDENKYLHKMLMPLFLAQLPRYTSRVSVQLDGQNIKNLLRTGGGNSTTGDTSEVIVACFGEQTEGGRLDIDRLIEKALDNPTVKFKPGTGRNALCVLSGAFTESVISENRSELRKFTDGAAKDLLEETVRDVGYRNWRSRYFVANFEEMKGFRLTILISGCNVPILEEELMELTNTAYNMDWNVAEDQRLAESLRSLDEADVRLLG